MLKINTKLTDSAGGEVVSGTIIDFGTDFPPNRAYKILFRLFAYKSLAGAEAGDTCYVPKEIGNYSPIYNMTKEDYDSLSPAVVHEKLKTLIAEQSGGAIKESDIEIVL